MRSDSEIRQYLSVVQKIMGGSSNVTFCGEGPTGMVFQGHLEELNADTAVKVLISPPSKEYFSARSKTVVSLAHPSIARTYSLTFENELGKYYIKREWVTGVSLTQVLIERGKFLFENAIGVVIEIARALFYAHEKQIVHGNIKPSNVFLAENGQIKLTDFCLIPCDQQGGKMVWGPQQYIAPEIFNGALPDFTSEIYNLGSVFFHLLTGTPPGPSPVLSDDIPEEITTCLQKMLAPDAKQRFQKMSELLPELEKLYAQFGKEECPRCQKKNSIKEIFNCQWCGAQNLCLSHKSPEELCCNQCLKAARKLVTQKITRSSAFNRLKLIEYLRHVRDAKKYGLLVLGSKEEVMGLNIISSRIELYLENADPSDLDEEKTVLQHLGRFFSWREFSFEFHPNKPIERIIPQCRVLLSFDVENAFEFLQYFIQILRLVSDITNEEGIMMQSAKHSVGILFHREGTYITSPFQEKQDNAINNPQKLTALFQQMTSCEKLQYRTIRSFAFQEAATLPLPTIEFLENLIHKKSWRDLHNLIPTIDTIIPATTDWKKPFGGIELTQISSLVTEKLTSFCTVEKTQQATNMGFINSFLLTAAIMKERTNEIGNMLVGTIEYYKEQMEQQACQAILEQAYELCPDNPEIHHHLAKIYQGTNNSKAAFHYCQEGNIYWFRENLNAAMTAYQTAHELDKESLTPRLRLFEIYDKDNHKDGLQALGLDLFKTLRQEKVYPIDELQMVCKALLEKIDKNLVSCRSELAMIYRMKKDNKAAVEQYEELFNSQQRYNNKEGQAKALANILHLDDRNLKAKKQLEKLGVENWKKLVDKPKLMLPTVQLSPQNTKKIAVAAAVVIVVLLVASFGIFGSGKTEVPKNTQKGNTLQEEQQRWKQLQASLETLQSAEKWEEALKLCKTAIAQFKNPVVRKQIADTQKDIEQKWQNYQEQAQKQQKLQSLWEQLLKLKQQQKYQEAKGIAAQIQNLGDSSWKQKTKAVLSEISQEMEQQKSNSKTVQDQKKLFEHGKTLENLGQLDEALETYEQVTAMNSSSSVAQQARQQQRKIQELQNKAQQIFAEGQQAIAAKQYPQAISLYQQILNSSMKYTSIAQKIRFPLVIESFPVSAECSIDGKVLGETPVVHYYPPGKLPEVQLQSPGFTSKSPQIEKQQDVTWKMTFALEAKPLWQIAIQGEVNNEILSDRQNFYLSTNKGYVYAVDYGGKILWEYNASKLTDTTITSRLFLDADTLYFATHEGYVYGISKDTGKYKWRIKTKFEITENLCFANKYLYLATNTGKFLRILEGKMNQSDSMSGTCSYLVDCNGRLLMTTTSGNMYFFDFSRNSIAFSWKKSLKLKFQARPVCDTTGIYGVSDKLAFKMSLEGKLLWKNNISGTQFIATSPKYVCILDTKGTLHSLSAKNGQSLWQLKIGKITALTIVKDTVFVVDNSNVIYAFSGKNAEKTWEFALPGQVKSAPRGYDNNLLIGSGGDVYSFSVGFIHK